MNAAEAQFRSMSNSTALGACEALRFEQVGHIEVSESVARPNASWSPLAPALKAIGFMLGDAIAALLL